MTDEAVNIPQLVREQAAWVVSQADHVRLHEDRIAAYTDRLLETYPLVTELDALHVPSDEYVFALDSVNFGSGYFHIANTSGVALEYDVLATGLKKAFAQGVMARPQDWVKATADDFHAMLGIAPGLHEKLDVLMDLFAGHLRDTGARIMAGYGGSVQAMIDRAQGSAVALVGMLAQWPSFQDVAFYKGKSVSIYKRAQILAADINLARGNDYFHDMQALTCFADNMVPHVLRMDGLLEYSPELAARIDRGDMIAAGGAEETELRAFAIHAVEMMQRKAGARATAVNLDHILWHRGYEPDMPRQMHRTLSVWY